jgi:predicted ATP-grasp superfamily ATP-dependent carboligase
MTAPLPVLILKTGPYAIHHGVLGIIRSLGRLGVPVYSVSEGYVTPVGVSRYLAGSFIWNTADRSRSWMLEALTKIGRNLARHTILIPTDDLAPSWSPKKPRRCGRGSYFPIYRSASGRDVRQGDILRGGIMDIDYRFDKRDGQYKLLDFNPRVGAQFRVFEDKNGVDVARALYRDLTGQEVRRSRQIDGRVFVVEPFDLRACAIYFWRGELSAYAWLRSFKGRREFAWFSSDDPLPFLMVWVRLAIQGVAKMIRTGPFKFRSAATRLASVGQKCERDQERAIA